MTVKRPRDLYRFDRPSTPVPLNISDALGRSSVDTTDCLRKDSAEIIASDVAKSDSEPVDDLLPYLLKDGIRNFPKWIGMFRLEPAPQPWLCQLASPSFE